MKISWFTPILSRQVGCNSFNTFENIWGYGHGFTTQTRRGGSLRSSCFSCVYMLTHFLESIYSRQMKPWLALCILTHWDRVTHICVSKLSSIGSDNGLSLGQRQATIWTIAGILSIGPLGTSVESQLKFIHFHSIKCIWKFSLVNGRHFVSASVC